MLSLTRGTALTLALLAFTPLTALADSGMYAPERVGRWYIGGGLGAFHEDSNAQLQNQDGQYAMFFGGGYRAATNFAVEIDGLYLNQRLDTPPAVSSTNARARLHSAGIGAILKFIVPINKVELYAGGGLGIYTTSLRVDDDSFFDDDEQEDTDMGYQGVIGADFLLSRRLSLGVEYRKVKLDADLQPSIAGKIDAGGDLVFFTVRGHF